MPSYPAFALLIGCVLWKAEASLASGSREKLLKAMQIVLACLGVIVFAGGAVAFWMTRHIAVEGDIAATLTRNPEAYALSLGHVLDLTPRTLAELRVPVIGTALTFLFGTIAAVILRRKGKHAASNVSLAMMMAVFFFFAHASLAAFEPYLSSRGLAEAIDREYKQGDVIVINGEYEGGSSLNFYTRKMVHILNGRSANLEYGSYFEDAPRIFIDQAELAEMWAGTGRVFLFTDSLKVEELRVAVRGPVYKLAESGGKHILTNQEVKSQ